MTPSPTMTPADADRSAPVRSQEPHGPQAHKAGGEFHIPSLDGIRAVSFMLVFVSHAGLGNLIPGGFGVTIFFFLSGYLITTLLRLEHDRTGGTSLRDFYLRRAFRILPPFYSILCFAIALTALGLLPEPLKLGSVFAQFAHITNYWFVLHDQHGFPAGTVVYWSLAVEEHFYLVFPCIFILLQRWWPGQQARHAGVLLGLCALVLAWRCVLVFVHDVPPERTGWGSDTRVDSILFGCVLAMLGNPMLDVWRGSKALWRAVLFPLGLGTLLFTLVYRAPWFRETLRYSLQGLALIPLFVVAIRYPEWAPMRFLNLPLVRRVGLLSYSLYLCHQVLLFALENAFPSLGHLVTGVIGLGLALVFSSAVLEYIERPSARARKHWVKTTWLKPLPAPVVAAPARSSEDAASAAQ